MKALLKITAAEYYFQAAFDKALKDPEGAKRANYIAHALGVFIGELKKMKFSIAIAGALAIGTYMFSKDSKPPQA